MPKVLVFFLLISCSILLVSAFHVKLLPQAVLVRQQAFPKRDILEQGPQSEFPIIMPPVVMFTPDKINSEQILQAMGIENGIFFLSLALGYIFRIDVFNSPALSLNLDSVSLGLLFGFIISAIGAVFDKTPSEYFKGVSRDSQAFSLFLLGRNSNSLQAILGALLLSFSAGFAEEIFFRGFLMQILENGIGFSAAFVISSLFFGLAHFPIFSANMVLESCISGCFAAAYWYSGNNIVVPIVMHTVYDLLTILSSWYVGRNTLNRYVEDEKARVLDVTSSAMTPFDVQARAVFDLIDVNKDGFLEPREVDIALRVLR